MVRLGHGFGYPFQFHVYWFIKRFVIELFFPVTASLPPVSQVSPLALAFTTHPNQVVVSEGITGIEHGFCLSILKSL